MRSVGRCQKSTLVHKVGPKFAAHPFGSTLILAGIVSLLLGSQQCLAEHDNVQLGRLNESNATSIEIGDADSPPSGLRLLMNLATGRDPIDGQPHKSAAASEADVNIEASGRQHGTGQRRPRNALVSTDCVAKRNEVLRRQSQPAGPPQERSLTTIAASAPTGFQRLRPRGDASGVPNGASSPAQAAIVPNEPGTLPSNLEGEHIPRCRHDGSYEPVQCHKIGYCWCVNKHGQAIKNSAVLAGDEPACDPAVYESDNADSLVVAGISAQRIKNFLKPSSSIGAGAGGSAESSSSSSTPNGHINFEATETPAGEAAGESQQQGHHHQQVDSTAAAASAVTAKRAGSLEPTMPLLLNNCEASRATARERAMRHVNDSIWVPECDSDNEKYYAERQCHRSRVCWCVDQSSGLPLRTGEQLTARSANSNCTEIRRILELAGVVLSKVPPASASAAKLARQPAFFQGSSEFCDADRRIEFVTTLNNQFRQQISEYVRQGLTSEGAPVPAEMSAQNPFTANETQVSKWKFSIMDKDLDGRLGDREWSKFKNNFKLVDKADELESPFKLQKSPFFPLTPLLIVRAQRKCWRDFLDFCDNGDLLVDDSISLAKWLSCTEVPPKSLYDEQQSRRHGSAAAAAALENTYAHSREAAIVRSKKKNPFLGILKPD